MRVPKAKQLPSGNWFIYLRINGEQIGITEPTEEKCVAKAMAYKSGLINAKKHPASVTLRNACKKYNERSTGRLSPSTIQGYEKIVNNAFPSLMGKQVGDITTRMLQKAVDDECRRISAFNKPFSPKTICNNYSYIATVLHEVNPDLDTRVRLPEIKRKPVLILTPAEVFNAVKGTEIELPVLLSMWLSFSMSEIRGLTKSKSIHNGQITVYDTIVDIGGNPVRKTGGKEATRTRTLAIPPYIQGLIDNVDGDIIVPASAASITNRFYRLLNKAGLPHIPFHRLRHINMSVMADLGIPDPIQNDRGGYSTDYVRKRVYTHAFTPSRTAADAKIDSFWESIIGECGKSDVNADVNGFQKSP